MRNNKSYEIHSMFPNVDWYNKGNYIIDETTEQGQILAQKVIENYPYYDLVIENGKVKDITILPKPVEPEIIDSPEKSEIQIIQEKLTQLEQENTELRNMVNVYLGGVTV